MTPDIFAMPAERLVIYGYRNVMAACDLSDATCWDCAWRQYIDMIGANAARRLMGELQFWVRVIRGSARKPLRYFPCPCRHICHDECMAVATLAAAQRQDRATVDLAGGHLLGTRDCKLLTELWLAASHFGTALQMEQLELYPVNSQVIESIVALEQRPAELSGRTKMH